MKYESEFLAIRINRKPDSLFHYLYKTETYIKCIYFFTLKYPMIKRIIFAELAGNDVFTNGMKTLNEKCVAGITANEEVCKNYIEKSIGIVTALNPVLGYDKSTKLAAEALKTGKGIIELVREKKLLSEEQIKKILNPAELAGKK